MFENLKPQPADKILALMQMYREDPRDQKIDLGVGVYKNAEGITPVMRAVKAAEQRIWEEQETKAYTGLAGDPAYADAMIGLILGTIAFLAVAKNMIATYNEIGEGKKTWGDMGMHGGMGVLLLVFVVYLLTQAATVIF